MPRSKKTTTSPLIDRLRAENEDLKQRLQQIEEECNLYRDAVQAWAREQFRPEDFRRAAAERDGLPLAAFIDRLEHEARGS